MKKLIFKKFLLDHGIFFIYVGLSISLIVWVIQAVNFLDLVSEDGHSFIIYFKYTLLNLPKVFSRILPFIFFISLFYMINKYENNNELIIFWTIGIKKIKFVNKVVQFSLLYLLLQLMLTLYIVPKSQDLARSYIRSSSIDFFPSLLKQKEFIDPVSGLTIFINKKNSNGTLENVFLKDKLNSSKSQTIFAKTGELINQNNKNYLLLFNGSFINHDTGKTTIFNFKKTEFNLSKYTTKTTTFPKVQEINTKILLLCVKDLFYKKKIIKENYDKYFECNNENSKNMKQELFKRIIVPLYLPLLALIALYLIIKSKDHFNYQTFRFILFTVGTLTIIFSEISVRYSSLNDKLSILFFIIPIVLFSIFYLFLLTRLKFLK
jgi:lipopolysaccharide export system permease protein